jgi:hypothetical protein
LTEVSEEEWKRKRLFEIAEYWQKGENPPKDLEIKN